MHITINASIRCSKCGSTDVEHVTRRLETFDRCCSCGHEGNRHELFPREKTGYMEYVKATSESQTF